MPMDIAPALWPHDTQAPYEGFSPSAPLLGELPAPPLTTQAREQNGGESKPDWKRDSIDEWVDDGSMCPSIPRIPDDPEDGK
eukprot:7058676-Pyramimonas_sp.AAC.1